MAERQKLTSKKLANCPYLMQAVTDAFKAALYNDSTTHRECHHCGNNDVLVTPTKDKEEFPGRQHFEVSVQSVVLLSVDKKDIEEGCTFEPQPIPDEQKV